MLLVSKQPAPAYLPTKWHIRSAKLMPPAIEEFHWAADAGATDQKEASLEAPLPHARPHDMTEVP